MSNIITEDARKKIYNSSVMKFVSEEKVEEALKNIVIYDNKTNFYKAFGSNEYDGGVLEGFNRNGVSYLSPEATAHTVIHEVLHTLSSKFDEEGHRTINGISAEGKYNFSNQMNEGATDYLASKISGESPRNYIQGHKLFSKMEPELIRFSSNKDVVMQMYLQNNVDFFNKFLNKFAGKNEFENLYNNFLFMNDQKIDKMIGKIRTNLNSYIFRKNIISKFKHENKKTINIKNINENNKDDDMQL